METFISYRHNIIKIDSMDMFLSIHGGLNRNVRDVYFVRELGEPSNFENKIIDMERIISTKIRNICYVRIDSLPSISSVNDLSFYLNIYEKWHKGEGVSLSDGSNDSELSNTISNSLTVIVELFKGMRQNVTDTMIKNFLVKLLFWFHKSVYESISPWNAKKCIKIVADNVTKDQEYLFYYMLTYLGCDVLLIQNRTDIESIELRNLSCEIKLGPFGTTNMTERLNITTSVVSSAKSTIADCETTVKMVIPRKSKKERQNTTCNQKCELSNGKNVSKLMPIEGKTTQTDALEDSYNIEKSFEELAQLAASVVLIAIHDKKGDVIGTGSGIMIGRNGYILTNNHVAAGGTFYSVRIEDDDQVYATDEVIKYNSTTDLAVIRIKRTLKPIPIYKSNKKLARGQKVVAIGSPLGLFNSVSDGIISGFRNIDGVEMIQFTAPISHGSSGGAVLNMQGEVVGISTAGIDSGQNINLAIGYENIRVFAKGFFDE